VFGHSWALSSCAAARVLAIGLALYEPPFFVDDSRLPSPGGHRRRRAAGGRGRREDAVETFMTASVGVPPQVVDGMRGDPRGLVSWRSPHDPVHRTGLADMMSGSPALLGNGRRCRPDADHGWRR
jgi:hypothetical protein